MVEEFNCHRDFYREGPYQDHVRYIDVVGADGLSFLEVGQPDGEFPDPALQAYGLYLMVSGAPDCHVDCNDEIFTAHGVPGTLLLTPPGAEANYRLSARHAFLLLSIPEKLVEGLAGGREDARMSIKGLRYGFFRDRFIADLLQRMHVDATSDARDQTMLFETSLLHLLARLISRGMPVESAGQRPAALTRRKLSTVVDAIESLIDTDITNAQLADLVGLSEWQLLRGFKAMTGRTPYQFVLDTRLSKARRMLREGEISIAGVALACGFSSQSHLTDIFRKRLNVTPGQYRAALYRR